MGPAAARWRVPDWVDPDDERAGVARAIPPGIYCADSERTAWLVVLRRDDGGRPLVTAWRVGVGMYDPVRAVELDRAALKRVRVMPEALRPELWRRAAQAAGEMAVTG